MCIKTYHATKGLQLSKGISPTHKQQLGKYYGVSKEGLHNTAKGHTELTPHCIKTDIIKIKQVTDLASTQGHMWPLQ